MPRAKKKSKLSICQKATAKLENCLITSDFCIASLKQPFSYDVVIFEILTLTPAPKHPQSPPQRGRDECMATLPETPVLPSISMLRSRDSDIGV